MFRTCCAVDFFTVDSLRFTNELTPELRKWSSPDKNIIYLIVFDCNPCSLRHMVQCIFGITSIYHYFFSNYLLRYEQLSVAVIEIILFSWLSMSYCNWTVDDTIFALIFCERSTYFLELIVLILLKINLSVRNNLLLMMNIFFKEFWSQICVLFLKIDAILTMCTLYHQRRLNLVSEICLVDILIFSAWGVTVIF